MILRDENLPRTCIRSRPHIPCFAERTDLDEEERWLGCQEIQKGFGPGSCEFYLEGGIVDGNKEVAARLKLARKAAGMTGEKAAKRIKRSAKRYADLYAVSVGWLKTGEGKGPEPRTEEPPVGQKAGSSGQKGSRKAATSGLEKPRIDHPLANPIEIQDKSVLKSGAVSTENQEMVQGDDPQLDTAITLNLTTEQYQQLREAAARAWLTPEAFVMTRIAGGLEVQP